MNIRYTKRSGTTVDPRPVFRQNLLSPSRLGPNVRLVGLHAELRGGVQCTDHGLRSAMQQARHKSCRREQNGSLKFYLYVGILLK